jgi:hypothetical protein
MKRKFYFGPDMDKNVKDDVCSLLSTFTKSFCYTQLDETVAIKVRVVQNISCEDNIVETICENLLEFENYMNSTRNLNDGVYKYCIASCIIDPHGFEELETVTNTLHEFCPRNESLNLEEIKR